MNKLSLLGCLKCFSDNPKSKIENPNWLGIVALVFAFPMGGAVAIAEAQQAKKVPVIGYFTSGPAGYYEAFRLGLRDLGYFEGKNIVIEKRVGKGALSLELRRARAAELVRLKVDVIVVTGPNDTRVASEATSTIPIVTILAGDPGYGFVTSLARPGGNITGLSRMLPELAGKRLELLKEIIANLSLVASFMNRDARADPRIQEALDLAAGALDVKLQSLDIRSAKDLAPAFQAAAAKRVDAVLFRVTGPVLSPHRAEVAALAVKNRLPVIYERAEEVEAGGLMSYGVNTSDLYRRAASYVDKILKGRTPADLPVEQPVKFEFAVNLKAAQAIGLTIPPNVLVRATRVIR